MKKLFGTQVTQFLNWRISMTEQQFEQAMNTYQLDMEYTDYIMDRANVGNGEILIRLMERGDFYEGFKESMVT